MRPHIAEHKRFRRDLADWRGLRVPGDRSEERCLYRTACECRVFSGLELEDHDQGRGGPSLALAPFSKVQRPNEATCGNLSLASAGTPPARDTQLGFPSAEVDVDSLMMLADRTNNREHETDRK
jgi:hypothetical protein